MKARATVCLKLASEKKLWAVVGALGPEVRNAPSARSQVRLEREKNLLVLTVGARDSVALRATLNAYLRWINSILNVFHMLENREKLSAISG